MIVYRGLALAMWFGIAFAATTAVVAAALVLIIGAVVVGIISPSRTPASCLRSLYANASAAVEQVQALKPS
jgi:hypothetical protein